ncbi:MAG: ATP-binding protein [Coriobacteriales bacterium]
MSQQEPVAARHVARIAVYDDLLSAPRIIEIQPAEVSRYIENIASTTYELASQQGGVIPYTVIREVSENFIHAQFKEITVSILDHGCTIRFADQGPGIENKDRAQLPGFSSATAEMKDYIRGVGSGLPIVKEYLKFSNGRLVIEDNIRDGAVVTIAVDRNAGIQQQPVVYQESPVVQMPSQAAQYGQAYSQQAAAWQQPQTAAWQQPAQPQWQQPAYAAAQASAATMPAALTPAGGAAQLDQRELDILALATEMSVGPTDITNRMGIPSATAYRILDKLQKAGLLMSDENHKGKRMLTQLGLAALREQV